MKPKYLLFVLLNFNFGFPSSIFLFLPFGMGTHVLGLPHLTVLQESNLQ